MKAKVISQLVYESFLDFSHGLENKIKRLFIEEAGNLVITIYRDSGLVFTDFQIESDCEILGEVEVSAGLVAKALTLTKVQAEMDDFKDTILTLLGESC